MIFTNNKTNDRTGEQLQPGHFKESGFHIGKELYWYP